MSLTHSLAHLFTLAVFWALLNTGDTTKAGSLPAKTTAFSLGEKIRDVLGVWKYPVISSVFYFLTRKAE